MTPRVKTVAPWSGGKEAIGAEVWTRLGDPRHFIVPFAGMLGVLRTRPTWRPGVRLCETVNDLDGGLSNALRALAIAPEAVVDALTLRVGDEPDGDRTVRAISELEQRAWARELIASEADLRAQLAADPRWCDPELAAGWLWGASGWMGRGWPADVAQIPAISARYGRGVHAKDGLQRVWMLARRLRHVRVLCGDWRRLVASDAALGMGNRGMCPVAVFLDPPYGEGSGYQAGEDGTGLAREVWAWAVEAAQRWPELRIAVAGYEDGRDVPDGWVTLRWSTRDRQRGAGRARSTAAMARADRETLWFSPACLTPRVARQGSLFAIEPETVKRGQGERHRRPRSW